MTTPNNAAALERLERAAANTDLLRSDLRTVMREVAATLRATLAQPDALTSQPSGEDVRDEPLWLQFLRKSLVYEEDAVSFYLSREQVEYLLPAHPSADAPGVAVDEMQITKADFMKAVSIELMLTFADDSASAGKAYTAISKVTAALAPKPEGGHAD